MSNYSVTFRIANIAVNGLTYSERRERLIENIRTEDLGYWDGTTSFFFVESTMSTYDFGHHAVQGLSSRDDMVVIFDPSDMSACYFGQVESEEVLLSFLPDARKLG